MLIILIKPSKFHTEKMGAHIAVSTNNHTSTKQEKCTIQIPFSCYEFQRHPNCPSIHLSRSLSPNDIPKTHVLTMAEGPSELIAELSGEQGDRRYKQWRSMQWLGEGGLVGGV